MKCQTVLVFLNSSNDARCKQFRRHPRQFPVQVGAGKFGEIILLSNNACCCNQYKTDDKNQILSVLGAVFLIYCVIKPIVDKYPNRLITIINTTKMPVIIFHILDGLLCHRNRKNEKRKT